MLVDGKTERRAATVFSAPSSKWRYMSQNRAVKPPNILDFPRDLNSNDGISDMSQDISIEHFIFRTKRRCMGGIDKLVLVLWPANVTAATFVSGFKNVA